ncbi:MAG: T9SS type A sorting domain-containing protein [Ignavibacterium sp.]
MKYLIFIILLFLASNIFSQIPQEPQISITFTLTDGRSDTRIMKVGIDPSATDGIDEHLGEADLPPFPPLTVFEARYSLPENNFSGTKSSYWDFRNGTAPFSGTVEHRIHYQRGEGDSVVIFWDLPSSVTAVIQDIITGTLINVQMSGQGSYAVTNPDAINKLKLLVTYNNTTSATDYDPIVVKSFKLYQNYPNPFNPSTNIKFELYESSNVSIKIYDILGNEIENLINENKLPGIYSINYKPNNEVKSGVYFYEFKVTNSTEIKQITRKMSFIK